MHQHALSNDNHNVQKQNNPSTTQSQSTIQAKQKPVQAKQKPIQAKQKPIQSKQRPVQAKQRPVQRNTTGQTKGEQPQGSAKFKEIATTMGQQHGVDTSQLKATHNSSFPDTVNAEATIQGNKIDFAPGKDTEANMKHEVAHAIDNAKNGTPKGDKVVNGQSVDTTREQTVDNMAAQPLQRKENQGTENLGQQGVVSSGGPVQRRLIPRIDDKIQNLVRKLEGNPNVNVVEDGDTTHYQDAENNKEFAVKENGIVKFLYHGFGGDVVIDDDSKSTLLLGKFGEEWTNPLSGGTRNFVGFKGGDLDIKGLPEGTMAKVRGGGGLYDSDIPGLKVLAVVDYDEIVEYAQKDFLSQHLRKFAQESHLSDLDDLNLEQVKQKAREYLSEGHIKLILTLAMSVAQTFVWQQFNLPFLESAFQRGDKVRLVSNKEGSTRTSSYKLELDTIENGYAGVQALMAKYGYEYNEATSTFLRREA
ncbi:MAG TPA: hypothetical protein DCS93_35365 [Microscillaceae bacterium]|nr:hypothetical protein [Microscillaceae bacterium]